MLKPLNFRTSPERKLWITSDTHFNHDKPFVVQKRGYTSVQEHDDAIIANWNRIVGINDIVIHLGDFVMNDKSGDYTRELFNTLNGDMFLLWGNHNSGVKKVYNETLIESMGVFSGELQDSNGDYPEIYPIVYKNKVTFCGDYIHGSINGVRYVGSHFAYRVWDEMHHGSICLSGHSHGSDAESLIEFTGARRLDVGIDNFPNLLSEEELMRIMRAKKANIIDHHDERTISG